MTDQFAWTPAPADRDPGSNFDGSRYLVNGEVRRWEGPRAEVISPVHEPTPSGIAPRRLGTSALLDAATAQAALAAAHAAGGHGRGPWMTASVSQRLSCLDDFLKRMRLKRLEVAKLICWEVAKSWADALAEVDRTIEYGYATAEALREIDRASSRFSLDGGFFAQIRRSPLGVALCMGPYNYPLNETYTTLLPAIVMGNPVVMKLPRIGMLCHLPLLEAFAAAFPPGVVNVIMGDGETVVTPLMSSGEVDLFAFIGSRRVANSLKRKHPAPNRLKSILGLGAKNPAVLLADADLEAAVPECVSGALTFNGQRCTALKLFFAPRAGAERFAERMAEAVHRLPFGQPFADQVMLTPLPDQATVDKMTRFLEDAVAKGARVMNPGGGERDRTWFRPAVLYPVHSGMEIWQQEQFGPIVPIAAYDDLEEIFKYLADSHYGQQASVFGRDPVLIGRLIDELMNQVCRVNLNSQCRRGPDSFPFGGRKDSAEGTLSVSDALRVFSIRTLVAAKKSEENQELTQAILRGRRSRFLTTDYLF